MAMLCVHKSGQSRGWRVMLRHQKRGGGRREIIFIDNLLVRIHSIIEMTLLDWPCAMGI